MTTSRVWADAIEFAREWLSRDHLMDDIIANEANIDEAELANRNFEAMKEAAKQPDTIDYDVLSITATSMLRQGKRLPPFLAEFSADVHEGKRERPKRPGRDKNDNWLRDYELARAVIEISVRFGLSKYSNSDTYEKITAAEVVAEAAGETLDVVKKAYKKLGGDIVSKMLPQSSKD